MEPGEMASELRGRQGGGGIEWTPAAGEGEPRGMGARAGAEVLGQVGLVYVRVSVRPVRMEPSEQGERVGGDTRGKGSLLWDPTWGLREVTATPRRDPGKL